MDGGQESLEASTSRLPQHVSLALLCMDHQSAEGEIPKAVDAALYRLASSVQAAGHSSSGVLWGAGTRSEWTLTCMRTGCRSGVWSTCHCCLTSLSLLLRAGQEGTWLTRPLNVNTFQQNWHCSTAFFSVSLCSCEPTSHTEDRTSIYLTPLCHCLHSHIHQLGPSWC